MSNYLGSFIISEGLRTTFTLFLLVGNFLSVNFAFIFMILSWYVKLSLDKQISFLRDFYQPAAVPMVMLITGICMVFVSFLGIKCAIGGRIDEDDFEPPEAKSAATFFFVFWILAFVVCIVICAAAFVCFLEIYELETALGKGLKSAMLKYRTHGTLKVEFDLLQMDYQCCGIGSFKDWFNVSWIDLQYLDLKDNYVKKKVNKGFYLGQDVPFSCCQIKATRPCVDTRVMDKDYHSNYNPQTDNTLNVIGCREALVQFLGHAIFKAVGIFVLVCQLIWIIMCIFARYLQTSLKSLSQNKPPMGWLIGISIPLKGKGDAIRDSLIKRSEDEVEDGTEYEVGNEFKDEIEDEDK